LLSFHIFTSTKLETESKLEIRTAAPDEVATAGWVVPQICCKHVKRLLILIFSCYSLVVHQIFHQDESVRRKDVQF